VLGNGNVTIGTLTGAAAKLNLPVDTVAAGGINFGGDAVLYRSAAGVIRTDTAFTSAGLLTAGAGINVTGNLNLNGYGYFVIGAVDDGLKLALGGGDGTDNNNFILTTVGNYLKDHDHDTLSPDPKLWIHSATDPDTANTQWGSLTHNRTNFVIGCGLGNLVLAPAANVIIGATATDGSAVGCLAIANNTQAGGTVADQIIIGSKDASSGGATLSLWTECAPEAIGTFTASHKHKTWVNGVEYWVALDAV
jgi:hypothetical protein